MKTKKIRNRGGIRLDQVFIIGGIACALMVIWVAYEFGQIRAGHNEFEAWQRYSELEGELKEERAKSGELRRKIALLETDRKIDAEAYAQVDRRLIDLQNEILSQQEDLAFYRGIVADQKSGLRVQGLELQAGRDEGTYNLRLVLAQAMRATQRISGTVELKVEGIRNGEPQTLGLSELGVAAEQRKELKSFSFRYFQNLEADLVIPEGFSPQRVIVKLTPKGGKAKSVEKSFDWTVRTG